VVLAPGPTLQTPNVSSPPGGGIIPFRQATIERTDVLISDTISALGTSGVQRYERPVDGSGYLYGILLELDVLTASNSATTAYFEDAPWSAFDTIGFRDPNGELVSAMAGYNLYLANLVNHDYQIAYSDTLGGVTPNTNIYKLTSGSGGTGGSFRFFVTVPLGLNRRSLTGIVGNQDRAVKYLLRSDIASGAAASTGPIYTTAPTTQGAVTLNRYPLTYTVPLPTGPSGQRQASYPIDYGTLHFTTATQSDAVPVGGSTVNHQLRRLGNTIRWITLVMRSNASRSTANTNAPTNIMMKVGDDVVFNETYDVRRKIMWDRLGFEMPNGVLVYDAIHDLGKGGMGGELGYDYYYTQSIVNAQFQIAYPSGFGSTNNSLQIITDDLQMGRAPMAA
jgi:hypothetical protein